MANRGYRFTVTNGLDYYVPDPDVLLCPVRQPDTPHPGFPSWQVEFSASEIRYFRRFNGSAEYSLMELGDGTLEFRDVDIDTLMYTMTPTYDSNDEFAGYAIEWIEYTTDDRPDTCSSKDGVILPVDESGDSWVEFSVDMGNLMFPVYLYEEEESTEVETGDEDEDEDEDDDTEPDPVFYLDMRFDGESGATCALWNVETGEPLTFTVGSGEYDTQHRRIYSLDGPDVSVLHGDDGFSLYDDSGDRIGSAVRYDYSDDEDSEDVGGMASFSGVTLESYLERFASDARRSRSEDLRREVWDSAVASADSGIDKLLRMLRMCLDAAYEWENESWPVDTPLNYMRAIEGTEYTLYAMPDGVYELRDESGEVRGTVRSSTDGGDGKSWTVYDENGVQQYVVVSDGQGAYTVSDTSGATVYTVSSEEAIEDYNLEDFGEYSFSNKYSPIVVTDTYGNTVYEISSPVLCDDPFDGLTFAEFKDYIPLRRVGDEWKTYAGATQYYVASSDNLGFWLDVYNRWNQLKYRISKPEEWDYADREVYSADGDLVSAMTMSALVSESTGEEVAKLYADPAALYTYQLFDNGQGSYNYLTHYENDMVVVVNQKGNVVCYVTPAGEYRSSVWYLFGYVGDGEITNEDGETIYTFSRRSGDWNIYDADGNLVGHLFSATTPNNEWTIASGCQRLFTFLSTESTVVISSDGQYYFRSKDGKSVVESRVVVQSNEFGTLQLQILDEDGEEMYRVTPTGGGYYCEAANGVAFDTANAYGTYSQGNMVLTRYWSTPYARMMYSCTNDQPEGTFSDVDGGNTSSVSAGISALDSNVGSISSRSVPGSGISLLSDAGEPRTIEADSTSSSSTASSGGGGLTSDGISDMLEQAEKFFDGILGVLSKGTNTAKGEDLDPDNPLQISQTETDGRLFADAVFTSTDNMTPSEKIIMSDTYDYTQAVTRLSKVYSAGRSDYYKEAQDYSETQANRLEYKKAAFNLTMGMTKNALDKTGGES